MVLFFVIENSHSNLPLRMHKYKLITPISAKGSVKKAKLIEAYSKSTLFKIGAEFYW